ncbi:MAG: preprotein translocase subunit SecA [Bacteroidia bacterium]|nr:preprotein translocase subunit SecA [Bacteroidia bacterium]
MLEGFVNVLSKVFGSKHERDVKELQPVVDHIIEIEQTLTALTHDQLREKTLEFKKRISEKVAAKEAEKKELKQKAESDENMPLAEKEEIYRDIDRLEKEIITDIKEELDQILPEAFAVIRETARRFKENEVLEVTATDYDKEAATHHTHVIINGGKAVWKSSWLVRNHPVRWDMVPYPVQLIGGAVLHSGKIAEMATGEGKTLVAIMPLYLNALSGRGVHLVTVNDYLAKRDSEWMGPLFQFHGLKVDCIDKHEPNSEERRAAYLADITYGTNNEFGFDYLRDNMARSPEDLVQRGHYYSIVDEVDSVLIDDARTPLIISGPTPRGDKHEFFAMKPRVEKLINAQRTLVNKLLVDAKKLLDEKNEKEAGLPLLRAHHGLPKNKAIIKLLSEDGNRVLLQKTENFYLQDQGKEMHKVDDELFFVIDEKNNTVELTDKGYDLITAQGEDPKFFILPDVGGEIAEIERMEAADDEKSKRKDELLRDFAVKSERVHTINQLVKAYTLFEKDVEYVVMEGEVKIVDEQTGRVLEGRRYSDGLHQAIEAKENVKIEAETQTYATITLQNYFRMYSKLAGMTGTAETEAGEFWSIYKLEVVNIPTNRSMVREDREDLVYKTKREKYNAVIDEIQACVKAGRPVLVGTTSVEVSELLSRMLKLRGLKHNVLNAKQHQREAEIVAEAGNAGVVTIATNMAGRGTDIKLGDGVAAAGGLAIIGTERHESRRVDRQLRGRSGRQGDPGSSQFFVSLEDDLMRLFGSERIARMMDRMGIKEGEVIQHSIITKSIERAQKKVEENNFGTRKRLIDYDDVMNQQREVVYTRRRHALFGERIAIDIANTFLDVSESIGNEYHGQDPDFEGFKLELFKTLGMESPFDEKEFENTAAPEIGHTLGEKAQAQYQKKCEKTAETVFPFIKNVHEDQTNEYANLQIPFTDGLRIIPVIANIESSFTSKGREVIKELEKTVILAVMDDEWKEHLREMDDLRQSVQNAVYEQKDPLLVYKFESFNLFSQMLVRMNKSMASFLLKNAVFSEAPKSVQEVRTRELEPELQTNRNSDEPQGGNPAGSAPRPPQPAKADKRVGRNDPCPCGSGKKYKNCHGK